MAPGRTARRLAAVSPYCPRESSVGFVVRQPNQRGVEVERKRNLAARIGGWSIEHKKTAVFGWLAFVIAAFVIGSIVVGQTQLKQSDNLVGESHRAAAAVDKKFDDTESNI